MINETEQKLLDAALKVFAEKGYTNATTKVIAEEAGFSENTLFRKFKNKENLFYVVVIKNHEKMRNEFELVLVDNGFQTSKEFLKALIVNLADTIENNFETFDLTFQVRSKEFEPIMLAFNKRLTEYLEKNLENSKIDCEILSLTIISFIYLLNIEKNRGYTFVDSGEAIEKFVDNFFVFNEKSYVH